MASKQTLNQANLEALGAKRLAELLIEISTGNAAAKRLLRLELAGAGSPDELAREIRKRLATIARSRSFVDWQNRKALVDDLAAQRRAIVDRVAASDPVVGLELMWRFLDLAKSVFDRCDDSSGTISGIFHQACQDLGSIAETARIAPRDLADRAYQALVDNAYGQFDGLIGVLAPALGQEGLEHLKQRMIALSAQPVPSPPDKGRQVIGWGLTGNIYADDIEERTRVHTVRSALIDIADAQGDADAYIAQYDEPSRKFPEIAAQIARRLLGAGRASEALQVIDAAEHRQPGELDVEWEDARIDVLDAIGRGDEAQAARLSCFERSLLPRYLRAHLKKLPDFDDIDAEARALDHVERYENVHQSLAFLLEWPALDRASRLVIGRAGELDGNHYEVLTPVADALAGKWKLAATLVLRAMIDFSLDRARASRYGHAARHLMECASLAPGITDFGAFETHEAYVARLRREHPRKSGFWGLVSL